MAGSRPGLPALSTVLPLRQTVWGAGLQRYGAA
jgi:hypothetical protein